MPAGVSPDLERGSGRSGDRSGAFYVLALKYESESFFRSSKLMLPGAIVGATYQPGLSHDLSSWRLVNDDEGSLFQDTRVWQWIKGAGINQEQRQEHVFIGAGATLADPFGHGFCLVQFLGKGYDEIARP